jgi:hypothetical protein
MMPGLPRLKDRGKRVEIKVFRRHFVVHKGSADRHMTTEAARSKRRPLKLHIFLEPVIGSGPLTLVGPRFD